MRSTKRDCSEIRRGALIGLLCSFVFIAGHARILGEPNIVASDIEAYLSRKPAPPAPTLAQSAKTFVEQGTMWRVDPRLIVAIAGAETTFGTMLCGRFNAWNWFWAGSCPQSTFRSWDEGINTVTKFVRKSYLDLGLTTIPAIRRKYCQEHCDNWTPNVTHFYRDELKGDTTNLTFDH